MDFNLNETKDDSDTVGESTSKGAESSKCKFCDRVDELIKSSEIGETVLRVGEKSTYRSVDFS